MGWKQTFQKKMKAAGMENDIPAASRTNRNADSGGWQDNFRSKMEAAGMGGDIIRTGGRTAADVAPSTYKPDTSMLVTPGVPAGNTASASGKYNVGQGLAKAGQMGLTQIAKVGSSAGAWIENQLGNFAREGSNGYWDPDTSNWLFNRWNRAIDAEAQGVQQRYAENTARGGKAAQVFEDLGAATVAAVPQAIAALLTGGASTAAQAGALAENAAASSGLVSTISRSMRAMAKDPNFQLSFAQVFGPGYEQAKADGADDFRASVYAVGNGLMNAAVEVGGGIQTLPRELRNGGSTWKTWVDTMLDEGKEEVVQGVIERATQNAVYGRDNPLVGIGNGAIFDPAAAAEEFAGGAVVGGILGGGQMGVNTLANRAAYNAARAQYDRDVRQNTAPEMDGRTAEAVEAVTRGETITGNQAAAIARDPVAVEALEASTGVKLDTEKPISQLKREIIALASRDTAQEQTQRTTAIPQTQKRTQKAVGGFMEAGQRAYQQVRETSGSGAEVYAGFSAMYNAGLNGVEADKAKGKYAAMLTPEQRYTAYNAGLEDARAQVARENADAASVTTTAGAGLADNAYSRYIIAKDKGAASALNTIGKKLGVRIEFVDSIINGQANGQYIREKNLIQIAADADNPIMAVAAHEITHRMQDLAPEEYRVYRTAAMEHLAKEYGTDSVTETVETYRRRAEDAGVRLTQDQAMDEMAADFTRSMIENADLFAEFAKGNRTAAQKLMDGLKEFIAKVKAMFTGKARDNAAIDSYGKTFGELEDIAQKWQAAFDAAERQAEKTKTAASDGDGAKYQIKQFSNGMKYVQADRQVLFGNDPKAWSEQLENYINGKIRNHEDVRLIAEDGDVLLLTSKSAGKLSSIYDNNGRTMDEKAFERKANAAAHIDELIKVSERGGKTVLDFGGRHGDMAKDGWNYRTAYFMDFDGKYYRTRISVALGKDGSIVYNIGEMQERSTPQINGSSGNSGAQRGNASGISILTDGENVNRKFQLRGTAEVEQKLREAGGRYSYAALTSKPDMHLTTVDDTANYRPGSDARKEVVARGMGAAKRVGRSNENGNAVIHVTDTDTDVVLSRKSLRHGLDRRFSVNAPVTLKVGEILKNAVRVNELTPSKDTIDGSYVLMGAAKNKSNEPYIVQFVVNRASNEVTSVDVLYAMNAKKEPAALLPKFTDESAPLTGSTVSIADLLDYVNRYFPDILPEDVLRYYGYTARPDGKLGEDALYQLKGEGRLSEDLESARAELIKKYGAIPAGERRAREVNLPQKTGDKQNVSRTVRTVLEASATPDEMVPTIEELALKGTYSYEAYSDKQAIADAEAAIRDKGWKRKLEEWTDSVKSGVVSKETTALGWALYNNAANSGDTQTALYILSDMVEHQRSAAQALQATRILKSLSPETQLYQVQRSVENLQEEINKRYKDKRKGAPELEINKDLAEKFLQADTQEKRDEVMRDIYRDIGRQMPSRFVDKWNAWRYLAMLGNARTHVRNILGNAGFTPVIAAKNAVATVTEEAVSRLSGGSLQRTKAFLGKQGKALLSAASKDYARVQDAALGGGKYSDYANANKYIEEGRVIFQSQLPVLKQVSKGLETARKANSKALDAEDAWFSKPHYAYAMAQYCKANGITADMIGRGEGIEKARAYAIKEAQKATYRDTNAFSQAISELGRGMRSGKNLPQKVISTVMEGILPFRKTPANILVRGVEYSPIGLANGIKQALVDVRTGKKTGAEAIDSISAGLTGTGLLALGLYLAAQGLVRGHGGDDDKERTYEEMLGHQAYSLELPDGTSITLDWLAPECLPLFIGVNLWEQTNGGKEPATLSDILDAISLVSEPLLEMSCLQSLNDVFDAVGYAKSNGLSGLPSALANAATSYLTQALPTLLGQAERTGEDKRYTTYTNKNDFLTTDMQYTLGRASARIPGWDYNQIPYIDAWGRTEGTVGTGQRAFNNFLNPAYVSKVEETATDRELLRLYNATDEGGVFPSRAAKAFTVNGREKVLTANEYVKYAKEKGSQSRRRIDTLVKNSEYQRLSDADKARCVKDIYDMSNQLAKQSISRYEPESWVAKAAENERAGVSAAVTVIARAKTAGISSIKDSNGKSITYSKSLLQMQQIYSMKGLSDTQRDALFDMLDISDKVKHYNKAKVEQELSKMKNK